MSHKNKAYPFEDFQLLWIKAATTLPPRERVQALEDIAELCSAPFTAVCRQAARYEQALREYA